MSENFKLDYLSYSSIKEFAKSPNHYIEYVKAKKQPKAPTESQGFGTAFHCYLLEPDKFVQRFATRDFDKRKPSHKEEYEGLLNAGISVVSLKDFEKIQIMAENVDKNPASKFLMSQLTATEVLVEDEIFGYKFRAVLDVLADKYVADLKTCNDSSVTAFAKDANNFDYHLQGAVYSSLTNKRFCWIAVEKNPPYNVSVFVQSEEAFKISESYLSILVDKFIHWDGQPQGYSDSEFFELDLPPWHRYRI
jgi:hypothetical protein